MANLTPPDRVECIVMGVLMPLVAIAIVSLRLYGRWRSAHFGMDDLMAVASLVVCLAIGISIVYGTIHSGLGQSSLGTLVQQGFATSNELINDTKIYVEIANWLSPWALMFAKLSLLFFYRRIFCGKVFNIVSWGAILMVLAWGILAGALGVLQCGTNIHVLFEDAKTIQLNCLSGAKLGIAYAATDVWTDLVVLVIPIYWVGQLQLDLARKLLVLSIFAFGSIAVLSSIVRTVVDVLISPGHQANPDQLGYLTSIVYFLMLECGLSIIAACLPTFGSLLSTEQKERIGIFIDGRFGSRRALPYSVPKSWGKTSSPVVATMEIVKGYPEAPYVPRHVRTNTADIETNVVGDLYRPHGSPEGGHIFVRTEQTQVSWLRP